MTERYILCRPRGGLNDTLVQIERCRQVALAQGRTLVLDTCGSGLQDDIFRYLEPLESAGVPIVPPDAPGLPDFDTVGSVAPVELTGRVSSYELAFRDTNFFDEKSGVQLTFDPVRDRDAVLLVHEQCGGGKTAHDLLRHMRFRPEIARSISDRLSSLPAGYAAVHIRNTDYQTDVAGVLRKIRWTLWSGDLLVCSDNRQTMDAVAAALPARIRVHRISDVPDLGGAPLHEVRLGAEDRFAANLDLFCDLVALAASRRLYVARHKKGHLSGFSRLAQRLQRTPEIMRGLMAQANGVAPAGARKVD